MVAPVVIFIGGAELTGWTQMTLSRSKSDMTGQLSVSVFFSYVPDGPVLTQVVRAKDAMVYIGGQLAFFGKVDKRSGAGIKHGSTGSDGNVRNEVVGADTSRSVSIGADEYTVTLTARGSTKYLVDSSQQHKTTNMMQPTNRDVIEELVKPWGIELDWLATEIKLDKARFRDGARVIDELQRVATENAHFIYETRDGKLRVTDDTGRVTGESLILGDNILSFSAEQSEDKAHSKIKVKGHRSKKDVWGNDAVKGRFKEVEDAWVGSEIPLIVQHYGDATDEALERRAVFEMNKRASSSKSVTVDVFHVQPRTGQPWDIGTLHYVQVPPEGIFDVFECTELQYTVQNDQTIKTTLTLSPPPVAAGGLGVLAGGLGSLLSSLPSILTAAAQAGQSQKRAAGITNQRGQYPDPWTSPDLSVIVPPPVADVIDVADQLLGTLENLAKGPSLTLPLGFVGANEDTTKA